MPSAINVIQILKMQPKQFIRMGIFYPSLPILYLIFTYQMFFIQVTLAETDRPLKDVQKIVGQPDSVHDTNFDQGTKAMEKRDWDSAIRDFSVSIHLNPTLVSAFEGRAYAYLAKQMVDDAVIDLTTIVKLEPTNSWAYYTRGGAYRIKSEFKKAIDDLNVCITMDPTNVFAYESRAACYSALGEFKNEVSDWTKVLQYRPRDAKVYAMRGTAYSKLKQYDAASADYRMAIESEPYNGIGYNALAWLQATCPVEKFRSGREAMQNSARACELTHWTRPDYMDTLAAAYAENGEFEKAIQFQKEAVEKGRETEAIRKEMEQRVSLYERKQPYRESKDLKE